MAFEKACSSETPTTEAEFDGLMVYTLAELNSRVRLVGFALGQRVVERHTRLPHSLLEDNYLIPQLVAQESTNEMCRSEAVDALGVLIDEPSQPPHTADKGNRSDQLNQVNQGTFTKGAMEHKDGAVLASVCSAVIAYLGGMSRSGCA